MDKPKIIFLDYIRVLATLAVIIIHVVGGILPRFGKIDIGDWWLGNTLDSASRFCVPVFVMLSGALLLSPNQSYAWPQHKKRLARIFIPFCFWTFVYILFNIFVKFPSMLQKSWDILVPWIWHQIAFGASFHFWYLYMILGLYLFLPWIHVAINQLKKRDIEVFLGIWFLTLIANWPGLANYFPHIEFMYFSGYLGYLVLGHYVMQYTVRGPGWWYLIGCGLTMVGTYFLSEAKGAFDIRMYGNLTVPVAMMALGIFGIFQKATFSYLWLNKFVSWISQLSFGIYFIHVIVLYYLSRAQVNYAFHGLEIGIPATTMACLAFSAILIFLLKKLPGADRFIG